MKYFKYFFKHHEFYALVILNKYVFFYLLSRLKRTVSRNLVHAVSQQQSLGSLSEVSQQSLGSLSEVSQQSLSSLLAVSQLSLSQCLILRVILSEHKILRLVMYISLFIIYVKFDVA